MNDGDDRLAALRGEIDALDNQWLADLAKRLGLADEIARTKHGSAFRAGREAALIRRHLKAGGLPPLLTEALLRQVVSASLARQQEIRLAFWGEGVAVTARFRFGVAAEYTGMNNASAVIKSIADGVAGFGMLPHWEIDSGWVKSLAENGNVYIVSQTPLTETDALVKTVLLASALPDASGNDISLQYDEHQGVKTTDGHNPDLPDLIGIIQKV